MPKRSLRAQLLAERRSLNRHLWLTSSRAAQKNLLSLAEFQRAECIALYAPAHNETDTSLLLTAACASGKRVLYPAVCGQKMVFRRLESPESLQKGAFGIMEPCPACTEHGIDEVDLIVVPGVAFDLTGHRIGYGKGFYDRFLHHSGRTAHLIGLCHDFQLIEGPIQIDPHDIPMEIVVTETRIVRI
ncbi:MAG TPA: 5-formyltetrahydrofolate cyclo-ligase [Desulfuromonadales bacterium]|nr:5-formyltetrahydrofolate cyclo-ligase [Desulfuromonadales bacterium]